MLSNLRPTTRKCVHLVARGHFRSRDKDGGHTIRSAIVENPMLHANFAAKCFIEPELWPIEVLHCGNWCSRPFCSRDLDSLTFIYKFNPYSLEIYRMYKYELPMSKLWKVIVWQTDRETRPKLYTTPLRGWSNIGDTWSQPRGNGVAGWVRNGVAACCQTATGVRVLPLENFWNSRCKIWFVCAVWRVSLAEPSLRKFFYFVSVNDIIRCLLTYSV